MEAALDPAAAQAEAPGPAEVDMGDKNTSGRRTQPSRPDQRATARLARKEPDGQQAPHQTQ